MAARRRTRPRIRRRPGKMFWIRPPFTDVTLRQAVNGVYSDIILAPNDFELPNEALNDTARGAPTLERLIVDLRYAQVVDGTYFSPGAFGQVTMLVEAMVFLQNDQFASLVNDTASFDTVLQNQRILGYEIMEWNMDQSVATTTRLQIRCGSHIEPKTTVKMREQSVGVAIRTNFDVGDAAVLSTFPSVGQTFLIKTP